MPKTLLYRRRQDPKGPRRNNDDDGRGDTVTVSRRTLEEMVRNMAMKNAPTSNRHTNNRRPTPTSNYPKPEVLQLAKTMSLYVKHKRALKSWFLGMPQRHSSPLQAAIDSISPPGDTAAFRNEVRGKLKEFQDGIVESFRKNSADRMNECADNIRGSPTGDQEEAMKIALHRLRKEYPSTQENFDEMLRRLLPNLPSPSTSARQSPGLDGEDMEG